MTEPDEDRVPHYPPGPALLYVHADPGPLLLDRPSQTITQVDFGPPLEGGPVSPAEVQRERRILRALLEHALWLLDREEGPA